MHAESDDLHRARFCTDPYRARRSCRSPPAAGHRRASAAHRGWPRASRRCRPTRAGPRVLQRVDWRSEPRVIVPWSRHQRGRPVGERVEGGLGQLGDPKVAYGATRTAPPSASIGSGSRATRRARTPARCRTASARGRRHPPIPAIGAEVQFQLGGRRQVTVDRRAFEIDDPRPAGTDPLQDRSGGRHRDQRTARSETLPAVPSTRPSAASCRAASATRWRWELSSCAGTASRLT